MSGSNLCGSRSYAFGASPSSAALDALSSPCHTVSMMLMRQPLGRVTPYSTGNMCQRTSSTSRVG